jgi:hypothetical protein
MTIINIEDICNQKRINKKRLEKDVRNCNMVNLSIWFRGVGPSPVKAGLPLSF